MLTLEDIVKKKALKILNEGLLDIFGGDDSSFSMPTPQEDNTQQGSTYQPQAVPANQTEAMNTISSILMNDYHWPKCAVAALLGNIRYESGFKSGAANAGEKAGTMAGSSANGSGYGAGLVQWSNGRKNTVLQYARQKTGQNYTSIEQVPLDVQAHMIGMEMHNNFPALEQALLKCQNVNDAAALIYQNYVAGARNSGTIPSQDQLAQTVQNYRKLGGGNYDKRIGFAQQYMGMS